MKILVACEFSGAVRDAFRALGHDAYSCDLLPTESRDTHTHTHTSPATFLKKSTAVGTL